MTSCSVIFSRFLYPNAHWRFEIIIIFAINHLKIDASFETETYGQRNAWHWLCCSHNDKNTKCTLMCDCIETFDKAVKTSQKMCFFLSQCQNLRFAFQTPPASETCHCELWRIMTLWSIFVNVVLIMAFLLFFLTVWAFSYSFS